MKKISKEEIIEVLKNPEHVGAKDGAPDYSEVQKALADENTKIEFAPTLHIEDLEEEVDRVLEAMGFNAWVTDMSRVDDFPLSDKEIEEVEVELGVEVNASDYIYQVAQRLKDKE